MTVAIGLLIFVAGAVLGAVYGFARGRLAERRRVASHRPCEHGFTDWDKCPVCCH